MRDYALRETAAGTPLPAITRHLLGLMTGRPGAKALRQVLSQDARKGVAVSELFARAQALAEAA